MLTDSQAADLTEAVSKAIRDAHRGGDYGSSDYQHDYEVDMGGGRRRKGGGSSAGSAGSKSIIDKQAAQMFNEFANTAPVKQVQAMTAEFDKMADPQLLRRMQRLQDQMGGLSGEGGEAFRRGTSMVNEIANETIRFNEELAGSTDTGN